MAISETSYSTECSFAHFVCCSSCCSSPASTSAGKNATVGTNHSAVIGERAEAFEEGGETSCCAKTSAGGLLNNGLILELQLPLTSKRLDCLVTGQNAANAPNAVIIELKQWEKCSQAAGQNEVASWVGGARRDLLHPSAQVGQYKMYLEDSHPAF